ncbi:MAG: hypothetical protein LBH25_05005 [Fibromonadaceae bacterium]|jgi:hypothetical protein|nr:hypothetical protein [Fibromonadaceae bacterium]
MKSKIAAFIFFLTLSCQGPWSYWPENPENYQGIWVYAYIVSGRPVENVCFDKMHALDEIRMPGFAFYNDARVTISGTFNDADTSFSLQPVAGKPNCFAGPEDLIANIGKKYELDASITWDSAGKIVPSNFKAKTYIPQKFKVIRAYDLQRKQYNSGYEALYLPPPMDLQSHYYIPEYSDDVALVRVTMVYENDVYWGENSIDKIVEQFSSSSDTARHAKFGDRNPLYSARNQEIANLNKDIDSIPILGINFPAIGRVNLLFYATTSDYTKYEDTYLYGSNDSRVKAVYNIQGGAGIFAGMLVDTFEVNLTTLPNVKTYQYGEAQKSYCLDEHDRGDDEKRMSQRSCIEQWDLVIRDEFTSEEIPWHEFPEEELRKILSKDELVTWCGHRNFPIYEYPPCGSVLVYYYKQNSSKSAVLSREAKKWCEEHKDDDECAGVQL